MTDDVVPSESGGQPLHPMAQQAGVDRIQLALAEDMVRFEDVDDLFEKVYAATSQAEIDAALVGLLLERNSRPFRSWATR